jgi:hypothetical protein
MRGRLWRPPTTPRAPDPDLLHRPLPPPMPAVAATPCCRRAAGRDGAARRAPFAWRDPHRGGAGGVEVAGRRLLARGREAWMRQWWARAVVDQRRRRSRAVLPLASRYHSHVLDLGPTWIPIWANTGRPVPSVSRKPAGGEGAAGQAK